MRTVLRGLAAVLLAILLPLDAIANECTVGCSCGNTCISCSDECHVGDGANAIEAGLLLGALATGIASLYYGLTMERVCAPLPTDEVCWHKVGFWVTLLATAALVVGAVYVAAQNGGFGSSSSGLRISF
jgi:hypothetical protein